MADRIINMILPAIQHAEMLGYWVAFFAALLETTVGIGLILPGSTLILFLGVLSGRGYFDFGDLLWFAVIGAILGDNINYYLGKKYGSRWIKDGVWFLKPAHLEKGRVFFDTHGAKSIFLGRFIPSVKEIVPFFAGSVRMRQRTFFIWNVLGGIGWGFEWVGAGYVFSRSLKLAQTWLSRAGFFLTGLVALFIIFYLMKWVVAKKGKYFWTLLLSLWSSVRQAIAQNPEITKLTARHPVFFRFMKNRFARDSFRGLPATVLALAFAYVLALFGGIIEDFITSDPIVGVDVRLAHLLVLFRNPISTKVFFWVTVLGKWEVIAAFTLSVIASLWLLRYRRYILPLLAAIVGSDAFTQLGKLLFHRPRPLSALYWEHSFSFPSGHATIAVAFYGFLTYIVMREAKRWETKVNICFAGIALVLLIGFSRLYLGVHYLSDVWAGYLVGALWLIAGISICEWLRSGQAGRESPAVPGRARAISVGLLLISVVFYSGFAVQYAPPMKSPVPAKQIIVHQAQEILSKTGLKFTETIAGQKRRPICFVIMAGNDKQFIRTIVASGWHRADSIDISSFAKLAKSKIFGNPYPAAPVTPAFWDTKVNTYAFRKTIGNGRDRKRYYARFWRTRYNTADGEHLYVGTVSLAKGILWRVTHKTYLDNDAARELFFKDLKKTGKIGSFKKIRLEKPAVIESFLQNRIFTDGFAYFIRLR
ncbi:MAG: LssY C-terminal domain-containing protein [Desulfatiglandaceae bacterium]